MFTEKFGATRSLKQVNLSSATQPKLFQGMIEGEVAEDWKELPAAIGEAHFRRAAAENSEWEAYGHLPDAHSEKREPRGDLVAPAARHATDAAKPQRMKCSSLRLQTKGPSNRRVLTFSRH